MRSVFTCLLLCTLLQGLTYGYSVTTSNQSFPSNKYLCGINNDFQVQFSEDFYVTSETTVPFQYNLSYIMGIDKFGGSSVLRWIGGDESSFWNWSSAAFVDPTTPLCVTLAKVYSCNNSYYQTSNPIFTKAPYVQYFSYDTFYKNLCSQIDCVTTYVLNVLSDTTDSNLALLKHFNEAGYAPKWFELGNEMYDYTNYWSESDKFATLVRNISLLGKAINPDFRFGVPIQASGVSNPLTLTGSWKTYYSYLLEFNTVSRGSTQPFDAIIVHLYLPLYSNLTDMFDRWPEEYWASYFVTLPQAVVSGLAASAMVNFPNTKMWVTEWGIDFPSISESYPSSPGRTYILNRIEGSGFYGLVVTGFLMTLSTYPIYEMATYFYAWSIATGGYNMVLYPIYEYGGAVSAAGQMFVHVANITAEAETVYPLEFPDVPIFNNTFWATYSNATFSYLQGNVYTSQNGNTLTVVIINRSNYSVPIDITNSTAYTNVSVVFYNASAPTLDDGRFYWTWSDPSLPLAGPIPVIKTNSTTFSGIYSTNLNPFGLYIFAFTRSSPTFSTSQSTTSTTSINPTTSTTSTSPISSSTTITSISTATTVFSTTSHKSSGNSFFYVSINIFIITIANILL